MKKHTTNSFFETFRRPEQTVKTQAWWQKKSAPAAEKNGSEEEKTKPRLLKRDTTTPPGRMALTFSREAMVIYGFALIVLLLLSHVWGYKRGVAQYAAREVAVAPREIGPAPGSPAPYVPATPTLSIPTGEASDAPFHSLQIISGIRLERAKELVAYLARQGHRDAFVYQVPSYNGYMVCVGRFANWKGAEARALKDRFVAMIFEGHHPFHDCYFREIKDSGRIVE